MRVFAAVLALGLAGCASIPAPTASATGPIAKGMARVVVTRSDDLMNAPIGAWIEVVGMAADTKTAKLSRSETFSADIPPGPASVVVNRGSRADFDALAGRTYRFAVSDNGGRMAATMAGGLIGSAIYESASGTSGFFKIEPENP